MVYNVNYNGLTFLNAPYFRLEWWFLCLKEFSFFEVPTSASTEKYALRHWEYVSPTLKKNRRIRILFDIIANTEQERRILLKKVQRAFSPEQNPSPFNTNLWKELTFQDVEGKTRKTNCQVIQWVQLSDFANEKWATISVELITDSSEFKSYEEITYSNGRNTRFWKRLWTELGFHWEYYTNVINYWWTIDSSMIIKMEMLEENAVPNKKINIVHTWEWEEEAFQIDNIDDLNLQVWDTIVVDTDERKVMLVNSLWITDITWMVTLWSQWSLLKFWENIVAIDTGATEKTVDVEIERNEIF